MKFIYHLNVFHIDENDFKNMDTNSLRRKYYAESLKCHPDRTGGSTIEFQQLQESYYFLRSILDQNPYTDSSTHDDAFSQFMEKWIEHMINKQYKDKNSCDLLFREFTKLYTSIATKLHIEEGSILSQLFYKFFKNQLHTETMNRTENEFKMKMESNNVIIVRPTVDDILQDKVHCIEKDEQTIVIPLWHNEMSYKVGNEEIIVKCIPDFDDTTWLDEENNLHKTIHMSVNNIEKNGIIRGTIGKNNYTLVAKELNIMYYQIKKLELKGVLKINDDLYCEERSDVFLHIYIKDFCFDW